MSNALKPSKSNPSLASEFARLDELLDWFDNPDIDIDEALKKFDQGVELAEKLKKRLATLENKIVVLKDKFNQESA